MNLLLSLATPSGAASALFLAGLLAVAWRRTRRGSWWLLAASGLTVLTFSSGKVATAVMSPLEYQYPALADARRFPEAHDIVVLTGWAGDDANLPLSGRLNSASAYRVLLALELFTERPDCAVIVTGSGDSARLMGETLVKLGIPAPRMRIDTESVTTADSARQMRAWLGARPFFLVTSAGHMPRTLASMSGQGLHAIPAPTDFRLPREIGSASLTPSPDSLAASDLAAHEYLGAIWYALRDRN